MAVCAARRGPLPAGGWEARSREPSQPVRRMIGSIDAKGTHASTHELNADWELAVSEYPLNPIDPLR